MGYNGRVFFRCGIQRRRFSSVVGYNRRGYFPLWDTTEKNFRMANNFFPMEPTTQDIFLPLYPTMEDIFLHCGKQRKRFFSVVGYNRRGFFPFWDTTEEVFFRCGIQWKKIIQRRMIFLNFKCLSLPSNKNLGKIYYLNN